MTSEMVVYPKQINEKKTGYEKHIKARKRQAREKFVVPSPFPLPPRPSLFPLSFSLPLSLPLSY